MKHAKAPNNKAEQADLSIFSSFSFKIVQNDEKCMNEKKNMLKKTKQKELCYLRNNISTVASKLVAPWFAAFNGPEVTG